MQLPMQQDQAVKPVEISKTKVSSISTDGVVLTNNNDLIVAAGYFVNSADIAANATLWTLTDNVPSGSIKCNLIATNDTKAVCLYCRFSDTPPKITAAMSLPAGSWTVR